MVIGVGIDIIEIDRIEKSIEREGFINRIFTDEEIRYLESRGYNPSTVAGSFATKEAVAKALGTGIGKISWQDIVVLRDDGGRPYVDLYGNAKELFSSISGRRIHVSISHSRLYAISQVIMEGSQCM